ncbi:sugar phosphate isomerase/epimerase and 4-hydroxyphenylpyruvate domain-containing protein [Ornithinimicrobium pekingense]|uniref:sugar phosphate isomerase/epimerase and 4-hydroxyphenylpyruvate domain-containing protein n=1 Tax=Ornithinimicrobium pekingense TaxID=384677 RepID=UPI0003B70232|nr:sugar phosphate isomerase/epimerase and 4-hydroxyphenylpyruvate domain-containing protein [Ornithinimicrobium pekingense]
MPTLETSVATVSLSGTLVEKLEAASAAGFGAVEIFEHDLLASRQPPEEIRRRCADLGLRINLFQPFRDLDSRDPARLAANLERARRKFGLMERLGVDLMLVCSSVGDDAVADRDELAAQLHTLGDAATEHGARIAYEALAWGRHVDDYRVAARVAQAADHPAVGTCLDSFHILSRGIDPAGILDIPGALVFFLQLADAPRLEMDVLPWSRHYRCFPGQGGLDVASVALNALLAGYDGPLSLEVFNDTFRQAPALQTARDAHRSLLHLQDVMRRRIGERRSSGVRAAAHELDRVEAMLAPVAPPTTPGGLAFVEFDDEDDGALAGLIDRVGFARDRTAPDATAWVHEDVWLATRPSGADRARVSGLGVRVPDPGRAAVRARQLGCEVVSVEALGQPLQAVDAPDTTRVTFCPPRTPVGDPAHGGVPGLLGIDHVALTQPWYEFDGATLFWKAVGGLDSQASNDVPDPYGLVRSQAMTSCGREVSVVLNVQPRRAAEEGPSGRDGTQHVAFATSDLLATADHLLAADVPLLHVGDNYYEDLEALYAVPEDQLAAWRSRGILVDQTGRGRYLQLFTRTVGGVFLEFVQRVDGYTGFGARNAPFRLAAQSRTGPEA